MTHKRLYSFVVDPKGEFLMQAQMVVWSLTKIARVPFEHIIGHVVGCPDPYSWRDLRSLGITLVQIGPYPHHPWCNKLQQLSSLRSKQFDDVVLLDCDTAVLQEPPVHLDAVQAKPVDTGNPPLGLLEEIYRCAGLPLELSSSTATHEPTAKANANGGVYVIPRHLFDRLAGAWIDWAAWSMERKELFADKLMHVDQVSFALAIASTGLPFRELAPQFNFPTHLRLDTDADCAPGVLHYHRNVGLLHDIQPTNHLPQVDQIIGELNSAWTHHFDANFRGPSYWNFCLKQIKADANIQVKQACVQFGALISGARRLLDVGAGNGQVVSCVPENVQIIALDYAVESKDACRQNIPAATWVLHDFCYPYYPVSPVDLVVCLDLLRNAPSEAQYAQILDNICNIDADLVIDGYDADPAHLCAYEHFHEELSLSLSSRGRSWIPIASYDGLAVFFSPRNMALSHSRDISNETLQLAVPFVDDHVLLLECIFKSRRRLGFFPNHLPRCIEYPWILAHLPEHVDRIVDAGAGVSVLPLMLADRGFDVITVDSHSVHRSVEERDNWTEWGFLDYSALDSRIRSINAPYENVLLPELVGAVVSVSVVEHLTVSARTAWFRTARRQLRDGGLLLLTIDTVPHTTQLWNYSEGKIVEDQTIHGDLEQLQAELRDADFLVELVELVNWLPRSRVGMARVIARAVPSVAVDI